MTNKKLLEIAARAEAATPGGWAVYSHPYRVHTGTEYIELRIGTAHNHPQLDGPSPVVTISASATPKGHSQATVSMRPDDAEFIAHARTDVPALVARIRELEAMLPEVNDAS